MTAGGGKSMLRFGSKSDRLGRGAGTETMHTKPVDITAVRRCGETVGDDGVHWTAAACRRTAAAAPNTMTPYDDRSWPKAMG